MLEIMTLTDQVSKLPIEEQPNSLFVCLLGVGTVFLGLVCLVVLCKIIGALAGKKSKETAPATTPAAPPGAATTNQHIENRQEIIAAVSAVIAEELGTDVSALRILSFKKI